MMSVAASACAKAPEAGSKMRRGSLSAFWSAGESPEYSAPEEVRAIEEGWTPSKVGPRARLTQEEVGTK